MARRGCRLRGGVPHPELVWVLQLAGSAQCLEQNEESRQRDSGTVGLDLEGEGRTAELRGHFSCLLERVWGQTCGTPAFRRLSARTAAPLASPSALHTQSAKRHQVMSAS